MIAWVGGSQRSAEVPFSDDSPAMNPILSASWTSSVQAGQDTGPASAAAASSHPRPRTGRSGLSQPTQNVSPHDGHWKTE
jgi:hypothetical protein